jgi:hypothetical protein
MPQDGTTDLLKKRVHEGLKAQGSRLRPVWLRPETDMA